MKVLHGLLLVMATESSSDLSGADTCDMTRKAWAMRL
jgi:hypothetical protein